MIASENVSHKSGLLLLLRFARPLLFPSSDSSFSGSYRSGHIGRTLLRAIDPYRYLLRFLEVN